MDELLKRLDILEDILDKYAKKHGDCVFDIREFLLQKPEDMEADLVKWFGKNE